MPMEDIYIHTAAATNKNESNINHIIAATVLI